MRKAKVYMKDQPAGELIKHDDQRYEFRYFSDYEGPSVSLTMPVREEPYTFNRFPPFFDGLLPEGYQLEALLKRQKIDRNDYFRQLLAVGEDLVGAVTVKPAEDE
jgi:serine/threonine-protein kinase HipA